MPILLRDVMNSKSDRHCRHSVNAYDTKKLSFYYAIESRIFNGIWDEELKRNVRGPLWFTNILVFDLDFDVEHYPTINDYESKLNDSLTKLENLLGKPRYKIFNKQEFTDWQKDVFFTKNGIVKLPKKYGCQVVYELKESLQSQYLEKVKFYNKFRMKISEIVDADLNFRGHMFKNPLNKNLFNIIENEDYDSVDIYDLGQKLRMTDNIDRIKESKPFESFDIKNKLPQHLKKYSNMLIAFYQDLNSWKTKDYKVNFKNKMYYVNKTRCSESRNETLFDYFKMIPLSDLETTQYSDIIGNSIEDTLFKDCTIKDPLDEEEFETIKQSVLSYRKENNIEAGIENKDNRVFKWHQEGFNANFFNNHSKKLAQAVSCVHKIKVGYVPVTLYKNNTKAEQLANLFLRFDPECILSNIRNLVNQDMLDFYKKALNLDVGMWDLYCIIKDAIYLTHFKYYRSIQKVRHSKTKAKFERSKTKREKRNEKIEEWGLSYLDKNPNRDIKGFKKFYKQLKKNGLLKSNTSPLPISFYQEHFHIRNSLASLFVKTIKKYISYRETKKLRITKQTFLIDFNCKILKEIAEVKTTISYKNHSPPLTYLIKTFNINSLWKNNNNTNANNYNDIVTHINSNTDIGFGFICFNGFKCFIYYSYRKDKNYMNIILFDTETTGLDPKRSFILSNGAVLYNTKTKKYEEFYEILNWKKILSNFYIPDSTIKVHGITESIMEKEGVYPLDSVVHFYKWIMDFVKDTDSNKLDMCVAFNLAFDLNMLKANLLYLCHFANKDENEDLYNLLELFSKEYYNGLEDITGEEYTDFDKPLFIDSMIIDQIFHFEVDGEKVRHNLNDVGERYRLKSDDDAHNSLSDTKRTFEIFKLQMQELESLGVDLDQKFENRIIRKYNKNQELWKKKDLDYLSNSMIATGL